MIRGRDLAAGGVSFKAGGVLLLTVFGKNYKANLTKAERNALVVMTKTLTAPLRR